tara:strand:+ start:1674 stop:2297 length:624 start_codon:yes stop_codon:yes gene_type:complete
MSFIVFIQVFIVCLLGAMSPGPSMALVINNAVLKNRYHGILTAIGHGLGITVYAIFAVVGIGLIIKTNIFVFNSLKILSIIFLFYLGLKSIANKNQMSFKQENLTTEVFSFFQGFIIAMLNPKIFIWFIAIYSQFMSKNNDLLFNIYLILTAGIVDTCWYVLLTIISTSGLFLNFFKSKSNILQKSLGVIFIIIGVVLLLDLFSKVN